MNDQALPRMLLRQLLDHCHAGSVDLAEYMRVFVYPALLKFCKRTRTRRKRSRYPSFSALNEALVKMEDTAHQANEMAAYLLVRLGQIQEFYRQSANPWVQVSAVGPGRMATIVPKLLVDREPIQEVSASLVRLAAESADHPLVVDFSQVVRMASTMLSKLAAVRQKVNGCQGKLALCGMVPDIKNLFDMTALDKVFTIYSNKEEAWRNLGIEIPAAPSITPTPEEEPT
jgi:anti-sigma B factor antagonist